MADFNVRSDSVNVEQIMEQIRSRIREKRGVDYTEEQIRELAAVKLQKFLDPRGVRSDLLDQFRRAQPPYQPPELPNYVFEDSTLFDSHRGVLRFVRRLLKPILKLFFNPNPLIQALHIQSRVNTMLAEREARLEASRHATESLYYELIHNLVVETTRLGIEVKNLTMRVESMSSRLEFDERRARALETSVSALVYPPASNDAFVAAHPAAAEISASTTQRDARGVPSQQGQQIQQVRQGPPAQGQTVEGAPSGEGPGQRSRRRRRRRGRRGNVPATVVMGAGQPQPVRPAEPAAAADAAVSAGSSVPAESPAAAGSSVPAESQAAAGSVPAESSAPAESTTRSAPAEPHATPSPAAPSPHGDRPDTGTPTSPGTSSESEPQ